jgi:hypothetical protein
MRLRSAFLIVSLLASGVTISDAANVSAGTAACEPVPASVPAASPSNGVQLPPTAGFHSIAPTRLLDTRDSGIRTGIDCVTVLDLTMNTDVPTGAEALALNVTTVDAVTSGFVTVYPCGTNRPSTSNVNPRRGDATATSVLVELGPTHQICMYTSSSLHLVVDMTGWFGRQGARYHSTTSTRLLDTRTTLRPDGLTGVLRAQTELHLPVYGSAVPPDARAVAINVTVTDGSAAGFVTVYPCSSQRPPTSTVNYLAAETRANHVVVGLDQDGEVCLWNSAAVDVVIDVEGWFGGQPDSGLLYRPLVGARVVDTRIGTGGVTGPLTANSTVSFDPAIATTAAGLGTLLPLGSTVALSVVVTDAAANGYVTLYPCSESQPSTSAVNAVAGTDASNVAFVTVDPNSRTCLYASTSTQVVVDVIGTFGPGGALHQLSIGQLTLDQPFTPDAHDYTTRCSASGASGAAGTAGTVTVHAVGATGTIVTIAPSTAAAPIGTGSTADLTLPFAENEAFVVRAGVVGGIPEQYWVRCLPHDFPVLSVTGTDTPNPGWYLTDAAFPTTNPPADQSRFLMILDNRSVPVWYRRVNHPSINLTLLADGTLAWTKLLGLAFGSTPGGAYEIHSLDGTLLRSISTMSGPTDHHDIAELPNGDVVLATYASRQHVDLHILGPEYTSDELVYDSHLEEIRPDGTVAWTWKSEDHIPVSATTYPQRFPGIAGVGVDLVHINSIHLAADGDLIVSGRHTDAVYKIRRNTAGDVIWRIGGNQSEYRFVNDPLGGFARQHDVQLLANGDLRMFDNRTGLGQPRAAEYALDGVKHTATLVWSATDPAVTTSGGVGSVRSIGDGDRVVAWGGSSAPAFTEFGPDTSVVQATVMGGHYAYRVDKQLVDALDIDVLRATAGH